MSTIASKNLYDLLGNDPELDPDREPEPPTKVADKPAQRTGKRNAAAEAPTGGTQAPRGGGRGGRQERGGDQAGALRSRERDDGVRQDRHANRTRGPREHRGDGERGRGRGGRGFSGRYTRTNRDDRADHTGHNEHEKQAAHGWGEEKDGNAEWNDEKAGEAIARAESKDEPGFTPDTSAGDPAFTNGPGAEGEVVDEDAAPAEPEDKTKSYDQYLAEQAEKRLALGEGAMKARKANEGSKQKFPEGTEVTRDPESENFFVGTGGKAKREKGGQAKKGETLALDGQYYAAPDSNERGGRGRGRGRGGRGGEFRGDRGGGRGGRGRGEFRGSSRGDRGSGPRGGINTSDQSAFPALGGS